MKKSYGVVIVSAAAALVTAALLAPIPVRGQLNEKDKAFKAKQIAKNFENNATVMTLRDRTGTVESPFLVCASIMSKKLAARLDALVLDVKTGSGAFLKQKAEAIHLAGLMVATGNRAGTRTAALNASTSTSAPSERLRARA